MGDDDEETIDARRREAAKRAARGRMTSDKVLYGIWLSIVYLFKFSIFVLACAAVSTWSSAGLQAHRAMIDRETRIKAVYSEITAEDQRAVLLASSIVVGAGIIGAGLVISGRKA